MSDPKYLRDDIESQLGHVVEECGETAAAIGKTLRWGLESYNPELPEEQRETNRDWILRELADLELASSRLRAHLLSTHPGSERSSPAGSEAEPFDSAKHCFCAHPLNDRRPVCPECGRERYLGPLKTPDARSAAAGAPRFFWVGEHQAPGAHGGPCYMVVKQPRWDHTSDIHAATQYSTKADCEKAIAEFGFGGDFQAREHGIFGAAAAASSPNPDPFNMPATAATEGGGAPADRTFTRRIEATPGSASPEVGAGPARNDWCMQPGEPYRCVLRPGHLGKCSGGNFVPVLVRCKGDPQPHPCNTDCEGARYVSPDTADKEVWAALESLLAVLDSQGVHAAFSHAAIHGFHADPVESSLNAEKIARARALLEKRGKR